MTATPDDWFVSSLRITAFGLPEQMVSARDAWLAVFGSEPDETRLSKSGDERCLGQSSNRWVFSVAKTPGGRLDLVQQALLPPNVDFGRFRKLQGHNVVLMAFVEEKALKLIKKCDFVNRIALGGSLKMRTGTGAESRRRLQALLPQLAIDDGIRELVYRVNRPTQKEGIDANRLCTWSDVSEQCIEIGPDGVREGTPQATIQLDLDLNTGADRKDAMATELLEKIVRSLALDFGAIVSKGDQK